jgi:hypothetical protein
MDRPTGSGYHPSIFQERPPGKDGQPSPTWAPLDAVRKCQATGPPYTLAEKRALVGKLQFIKDIRLSADVPYLVLPVFMSTLNARNLHARIIRDVHSVSGYTLGPQSELQLGIMMQNVYDREARNIDESQCSKRTTIDHVRREVARLNNIVAGMALPQLVNAVEQHVAFLAAVDKPVSADALARPANTSPKGLWLQDPALA